MRTLPVLDSHPLCAVSPGCRDAAGRALAALGPLVVEVCWLGAPGEAAGQADVMLCWWDGNDTGQLAGWMQEARRRDLSVVVVASLPEPGDAQRIADDAGLFDWLPPGDLRRLGRALTRAAALFRISRRSEATRRDWQDVNARMAALADSIPGLVFRFQWDAAQGVHFLLAAGAPEELLGVGATALEQDPGLFWRLLHQDERAAFAAALVRSARSGARINWEGRVCLADGDEKWINLRGSVHAGDDWRPVWEGVMLNITQGRRDAIKLRESRQRLGELSNHLQFAKEDERERIAREIHDVLGGHLVAVKFEASYLASAIPAGSALGERVAGVGRLLDEAIEVVGRVTRELRPGILRDFGLPAAIEAHAEDFARRTRIACTVRCSEDFPDLPEASAIALFRIFQEALTNVLKHARARHVDVALQVCDETVRLVVCDDGRGILPADLEKPRSFGLRGMQERLLGLGGRFSIAPGGTGGTRLEVLLPCHGDAGTHDDDGIE